MSDKKRLCPDPECNTETDAEQETCSKCGLSFDGFNQLNRILDVRERIANKAAADKKSADDANKKKKRGGLAGLAGF